MAVYASSDWHGYYNFWKQTKDILTENDKLIFIGDAADRGPDGWKIIKELLDDTRVIYIKGNHEQMLLDRYYNSNYDASFTHNFNGGKNTWHSFIKDPDREKYIYDLKDKTILYYKYKNVLLTHSGSDNLEDDEELLWNRNHFLQDYNKPMIIVHGHTPIAILENYFGIYDHVDWFNENDTYKIESFNWQPMNYCNASKWNIDLGSYFTHQSCLLNLDTWEVIKLYAE